ncbi:hypothetical protein HYE42_03190 [Mycoplasmopsis bovis]|nr:hypothetical protein [Mycoplasmopsis bovis]QQH20467.1 hypothetical protein HYE42_03190 [Mycoplasmopsis bovis]
MSEVYYEEKEKYSIIYYSINECHYSAKCHNEENNNINNQKPPAKKPIDPSETFEPRRPDVERTEPDNNENTNTKNVDFSDVQSLNKNLKITNYSYKKYDPKTAFAEIQKSENIFF